MTVLQTKEKVYTLDYLAEGSMHKVWTVEKEPAIVIKTPLQNKTPRDLYEAAKLTKLWHNHLTQREDISAVKFENDMVKDGFQIVERVSISKDEAKSPELRAAVLGLFLKTFTDPKNFISDLAPDNVIWDKEESKVKIIDPSSRAFTFTDMHEIATDIYRCLELWGLLGDCVKKLPDEAEGNKELLAQFKELLVKEPLG